MARSESGSWGEAVRYWLYKRKISQAKLARAIGTTTKTMGRIVAGDNVNTKYLRAIAKYFKVPLIQVLISPLELNNIRVDGALKATDALRRTLTSAQQNQDHEDGDNEHSAEPTPLPEKGETARKRHRFQRRDAARDGPRKDHPPK